jgi:hypothetical protein
MRGDRNHKDDDFEAVRGILIAAAIVLGCGLFYLLYLAGRPF